MASFRCLLTLADQDFPVVHCAYEFTQATTERGRVTTKVRSGLLTLHLDVPKDNQLLSWAADPLKKLSGHLIFQETNSPSVREKLAFKDGLCVAYNEIFQAGSAEAGAYRCTLKIAAAELTLNDAKKDNHWV